ncbi:hypothetical protein [Cupriavidus sp. AcVe19-6a]|uniref:hypothetical protein n=1 Tax=Cupriavidus sp. AcVe19-6a TaxID=2821358 RepID=UPI001AE79D6B|nr:hypothetical protein [Cupriavidus sp. AcVe19-6a]MBP0639963.1 hypothetical protein [Cupriavidus sp. AcVe19-6a]
MNQQAHEEICSVPIIPRMFFPYPVKVLATDTCFPIDFEAKGLLFETGEVVIEYPFKDKNGNDPKAGDDGSAIDIHTIVLPNGEEMGREDWKEVAVAPPHDRRLMASLGMMSDAAFTYGEGEGTSLFEQSVQADANVRKLTGLPYDYLLAQLGIGDLMANPGFEAQQKVLSVMMQDVVGDYDTPDQVPEWAWVEANASYVHSRNASDGIWEFMLNLSCTFEGDPGRLAPVITAARAEGAAYLIIHQGT